MALSPIVADRRWAEQLFRAHLFLLGSENTFTTKDAKSTKEFVATDCVLFVFFVVQSTAHLIERPA